MRPRQVPEWVLPLLIGIKIGTLLPFSYGDIYAEIIALVGRVVPR